VGDAFVVMAHRRWLGFAILKFGLTVLAGALRLLAAAAYKFDVAYDSVAAQMAGDGKIIGAVASARAAGALGGAGRRFSRSLAARP